MDIINTILPLLLLTSAGYLITNKGILKEKECDAVAKLAFIFLIPSLLFIGTAKAKMPEDMPWMFLLAYYSSVFIVYLIAVVFAKYLFSFKTKEQSVFGMGAAYSNATIVGIPVCVYALGEEALLPLFIIVSVHNLALFAFGILLAERESFSFASMLNNIFSIVLQLIKSPITGALIAGGILNLLNIPLPLPLDKAITLVSGGAIPVSLLVLGMSLNKYKVQGYIAPAIVMVFLKIILLPVLVWFLVFRVFDIDPLWASTALLTAAMPVGISSYIFSQRYRTGEPPVATGIVISSVLSVVTLSFLLGYLKAIN